VVRWDYYGLDYTFVVLSFRRAVGEECLTSESNSSVLSR
jgi:hypothetical protein